MDAVKRLQQKQSRAVQSRFGGGARPRESSVQSELLSLVEGGDYVRTAEPQVFQVGYSSVARFCCFAQEVLAHRRGGALL